MNYIFFKIISIGIAVFVAIIFIVTLVLFISPKLRAKMLSRQIKATKNMVEYSKGDLEELANKSISIRKNILDNNEDLLKDMSRKEANIEKEAIKIKAQAIKDGLTKESIYCKYCGKPIDEDSKFCKYCGKNL